ncbi:hypothetical protein ACI8AF_12905 [Blastococcus sp. SYSU D00669]
MKIDRDELVRMLRAQGDNRLADRVAAKLPEGVDTWLDADVLVALGLDQAHLLPRLAAGVLGASIAP